MACPKSSLQTQGGFPSKFLSHLESRDFCISSCPVCSFCSLCCSSGPCLTLTISHHTGQALTRITKSSAQLLTILAPVPRLEYLRYGHPCEVCWLNPSFTTEKGTKPQKIHSPISAATSHSCLGPSGSAKQLWKAGTRFLSLSCHNSLQVDLPSHKSALLSPSCKDVTPVVGDGKVRGTIRVANEG